MKFTAWLAGSLVLILGAARMVAAPQMLVIDRAQSRVEIVVKATVDSFTGKLDAYSAAVSTEGVRITAAVVKFKVGDIRTGKQGRDEAMNEWLEITKYPEGSFTLAALEPVAGARFDARGTLVLHGVSRVIAFPVSVSIDGSVYAVDGEVPLDTRDFGLPIIRKFGLLKVDPLVTVRFHLQGAVAADAANKGGKNL
jgi:polyisoprenoid-binding protein YceI